MTGSGRGFNLLEVMIALAIVALLALVALPASSRYLQEGRLQEAAVLLSNHAATLERRFLERGGYGQDGACPGTVGRYFQVHCQLTPEGYLLQAHNRAGVGLGAEGDYRYWLDSSGRRGTLRFAGQPRELPCWQLGRGDVCP